MKVEIAEPDTELPDNARTGSDIDFVENQELSDAGKVRDYHDIRASLAIINGYSLALKASFDELKEQYSDVLDQKEGDSDTAGSDRLMSLEADCRFCVSRLCSAVDQLKGRLQIGGVLRNSPQE